MATTQNAPATTPATPATPATAVATLLTAIAAFARYHTRGAVTMCSYRVAGVAGIVFAHARMFGANPPATLAFTAPPVGSVVPQGSTLLTLRGAVAGGKLGRSSYAALGIPGTFTVCNTLFAGAPPAAMVVNATLVATPAQAGKVTSAVVAAGNVAQASKAGTAVAVPAVVAQVARAVTGAIVAATPAATPAAQPTGKTAAQRKAHGKQVQ
jgi:hypothetical protein